MHYEYEINEYDYLDFQITFLSLSEDFKKSLIKTRVILILFYTFILVNICMYLRTNITLMIVVCIFLILFASLQIISFRKRYENKIFKHIKKLIKKGSLKGILGKKYIDIKEDRLVYKEENREITVELKDIYKLLSSSNSIFLYTDKNAAIIIPKRALKNDMENVIKHIESKINNHT